MRVFHVTRAIPTGERATAYGGLDRAVADLVAEQNRCGIDAEIVSVSDQVVEAAAQKALLNEWNEVADLGSRVVGKERCDVLHIHDWYGCPVGEYFHRAGLRKIYFTAHLPVRRGFTYRDIGCNWQAKAWMEARAIDLSRVVIAPSAHVSAFLTTEYGIQSSRVCVIPHGVPRPFLPYEKVISEPSTSITLLFVGRITRQKGVELALRALPRVRDVFRDAGLTIIGDGDALPRCRALVKQLRVEDAVHFVSFLEPAQLAEHYRRATLLIMPSLFEPFGLVGLEAMICGCPVIALRPTGASYLTSDELSDKFSPDEFADAIIQRIHDDGCSMESRRKVQERAIKWSMADSAVRAIELYREV